MDEALHKTLILSRTDVRNSDIEDFNPETFKERGSAAKET